MRVLRSFLGCVRSRREWGTDTGAVNGANVTNGGHYSGTTTATLTVSSCNSNDTANYRCVVTGGCDTTTSNSASLTIGVPGDFDLDGDVDLEDFGHFQACLSGSYVPQNDPACAWAKLADHNYVDQADMTRFRRCLSGPEIPADPVCAN